MQAEPLLRGGLLVARYGRGITSTPAWSGTGNCVQGAGSIRMLANMISYGKGQEREARRRPRK